MTKADLFTWYFDQKSKLGVMFSEGKITKAEYNQLVDKLDKQLNDASDQIDQGKQPKLTDAPGTSGTMTQEEYKAAKSAMYQKYKAGEITNYAYIQWKKKNDPALNGGSAPKVMQTDPGQTAADQATAKLEKELKKVYGQAVKEMTAKMKAFTDKYGPDMKKLEQEYANGTISKEDYAWLMQKKLEESGLKQQIDQLSGVITNANQKAMGMVNGQMVGVFAENANFQSYQLSKGTKMNLMFSVYDEHTAEKLIKEKPELLPRKIVNGQKDKAWNRTKIANSVTQAVLQGESIPNLAKRIAMETGETNMKAMNRYARTAMTSAQNSGRMEMLHRAENMGIKCKKVWLATLDSRTRDAHAKLDGQSVNVDEPFHTDFGDLMYPGDMGSDGSVPANLYNCRCTLIYEYEEYPNDPTEDQRIMYDEYYTTEKDADGKEHKVFHRDSKLITDMNYGEWKAAKEHDKLNSLNEAKLELADLQKQVVQKKIKEDKVYEGLWKDPVTLADYPDKKAGIQAKRDYYTTEIGKYQQAKAEGKSWATDEKIKDLEKKQKLLNEFEKRGQLIEKRNAALQKVQSIYNQVGFGKTAAAPAVPQKATKTANKAGSTSGGTSTGQTSQSGAGSAQDAKKSPFEPDAYSQERKDKALWSSDKAHVDSVMRSHTGEVWNDATKAEKKAIVEYTQSYSKFNEPLRGIEYGTSRYLGVGKTDLDAGSKHNGKALNAMTDLIDKCSYGHDMWLQRGVNFGGMDKFFMCSRDLLERGTEEQLKKALLGTTPTEFGFGSMGSAKGKGFSSHPIIMNIYAPAGTKMMYVEPFSHYGGHDYDWDGKRKQTSFGQEFETILQQGTQFRVTKVERKPGGKIFIDMEVINQDNQQRWRK